MKELLAQIDILKAQIDAHRLMEEPLLSQLRAHYCIGLTWSSNALEGSSLTESETKVLLENGLWCRKTNRPCIRSGSRPRSTSAL